MFEQAGAPSWMALVRGGQQGLEAIHSTALAILERVGVRVEHGGLRGRLREAGADVDERAETVRIGREAVGVALRSAPAQFALADRCGGSFVLGDGSSHVAAPGNVPMVLDRTSGAARVGTWQDLVDFTRLCDALPAVKLVRAAVTPADAGGTDGALGLVEAVLANTCKHVLAVPFNYEEFALWAELAERLAAPQTLAERPILSAFISITSPLQMIEDHARMLQACCARRIPIIILSSVSVGGTGPVTLAGTLAVQQAEHLFVAATAQLLSPGTPVCYVTSSSPLDLRWASTTRGGPLHALLVAASPGLAKLCGLPCYCGCFHTDSAQIDVQAGMQKAMLLLAARGAGASVCGGPGALAAAKLVSHEQLVLDMELYEAVDRLQRGVVVDEERLALDVVFGVGPGGSFLGEEHTVRWLRDRSEGFVPSLFVTRGLEEPRSMLDGAREQVDRILASHEPQVGLEEKAIIREFVAEKRRRAIP
ncbi:MAG: trimethylamine methyltransferase family protein [Bacteroidetes bacterium]|nr:trimethylamine methyltransferase family protein [Bacteroidota bacterium]